MISIISSEIIQDDSQPDSRRAIMEAHTLSNGKVYYVYYLAESGDDVQQRMINRVAQLEIDLNPGVDNG